MEDDEIFVNHECGMKKLLSPQFWRCSKDGCLDTPDATFGSAGFAHRNGMRIKVQSVIETKSPVQIDFETLAELADGTGEVHVVTESCRYL